MPLTSSPLLPLTLPSPPRGGEDEGEGIMSGVRGGHFVKRCHLDLFRPEPPNGGEAQPLRNLGFLETSRWHPICSSLSSMSQDRRRHPRARVELDATVEATSSVWRG